MIRLSPEIEDALREGGTLVVPSRQRAHAARLAFASAQIAAGRSVWKSPDVVAIDGWLTREVEKYALTAATPLPRLLSPAEEWLLWRQCTAESTSDLELVNRAVLSESLRRSNAVAIEYGIDVRNLHDARGAEHTLLRDVRRAFDERCEALGAASLATLVAALIAQHPAGSFSDRRVRFEGFLSVSPRLRALSPAQERLHTDPSAQVVPRALIPHDEWEELDTIAQWSAHQTALKPDARLLIVLPGAPGTRERLATLVRQAIDARGWLDPQLPSTSDDSAPRMTDALVAIEGGRPLSSVPMISHALATLGWLGGEQGEFEEVSEWLRAPYWLTPHAAARAALDLWLREQGNLHFRFQDLGSLLRTVPAFCSAAAQELMTRIGSAAAALGGGTASPRDWSVRLNEALAAFGWPGERVRDSSDQQNVLRLHELLDEFGQLAAVWRSMSLRQAIQCLRELAARTSFQPADADPTVTISPILAAPVVRYDAIWVAGLSSDAFPQPVQPDPFLPLDRQIAKGVPAASAEGRLAEARALVESWRATTDELVLSCAARSDDLELLPSPLLMSWMLPQTPPAPAAPALTEATAPPMYVTGDLFASETVSTQCAPAAARHTPSASPIPPAPWLPNRLHRDGLLESLDDSSGIPWAPSLPLPAGTRSLELQNLCPFRAYAELRLGSTPLDAPEPGVGADLRGNLLHAALAKLWQRFVTSHVLTAMSDADLAESIAECVAEAAREIFESAAIEAAPVIRECRRTVRLIRQLCELERRRAPFRVQGTELDASLSIGGAELRMRIDRVDSLEQGGRAILDYKSGRRATADWYGERPSHPQLLAYLAALGDEVVAMATVNVTAREVRFDGIAASWRLLPKVKGVEAPEGASQDDAWLIRRAEWIGRLEEMARGFLAGRAVVDPKPGACDFCHVSSVCRISDRSSEE